MDLAEEDHTGDIPFLACHIEGVDYQFYVLLLMLVLVTWLREYLSHLYTVECSFTPNLYGILWGKVSKYVKPVLKEWKVKLHFLVEYLHKVFGILHRRFVYSYPFIYVCNHLLISL